MNNKILINKVLKKDLVFIVFKTMIIVSWLIFFTIIIIVAIFGKCPVISIDRHITLKDLPFLMFMNAIINSICLVFILYKYITFRNIIDNGVAVKGFVHAIQKVDEYDMIDIIFSYEYKGKQYRKTQRVQSVEFKDNLKDGDRVNVYIDELRPNKFLIKEIYN